MIKNCFKQEDFETSLFIKKYCGEVDYEYNKKKNRVITISLPQNDKLYGYTPLYCEYNINNREEIKSLTIQTKKNWGNLTMRVEYFDSGENRDFILGNDEKFLINKPKNILIIFSTSNKKDFSPFSMKISDTLTPINIKLISICTFSGFLGIIIIIFLIVFYRRRMKKRNRLSIMMDDNRINDGGINNYNISNQVNGLSTERLGLINYLNQLKPVKYKIIKHKSLNAKCPIEMEDFDDKSEVVFTSCHHSFHFNCLKIYIDKNNNLKELKCPLCNTILYKDTGYQNFSIISNLNIHSQ